MYSNYDEYMEDIKKGIEEIEEIKSDLDNIKTIRRLKCAYDKEFRKNNDCDDVLEDTNNVNNNNDSNDGGHHIYDPPLKSIPDTDNLSAGNTNNNSDGLDDRQINVNVILGSNNTNSEPFTYTESPVFQPFVEQQPVFQPFVEQQPVFQPFVEQQPVILQPIVNETQESEKIYIKQPVYFIQKPNGELISVTEEEYYNYTNEKFFEQEEIEHSNIEIDDKCYYECFYPAFQ